MTVTWYLQGLTPTEIEATDVLRFAGGAFATKVAVGEYNSSTHVRASGGADDSSANTPNNVKYVASGTGDWGDGTEDIANITDAECTLDIDVSHTSAVVIEDHIFYAYDGTTTTAVPTGVTFQCAEQGDATWTNAEGSAAALTVTDSASATDHNFYIAVSVSPESVGLKSACTLRHEFTYS